MLFYSFQSRLSCCHTVDVHIYIYVVTGRGPHTSLSCPCSYLPGVEAVHRETNNSMGCARARTVACTRDLAPVAAGGPSLISFRKGYRHRNTRRTNVKGRPAREICSQPETSVRTDGYKEQTVFSRGQKSRGHLLFLSSILGYLFLYFRFLTLLLFLFSSCLARL